jgi:hypothetical protein
MTKSRTALGPNLVLTMFPVSCSKVTVTDMHATAWRIILEGPVLMEALEDQV